VDRESTISRLIPPRANLDPVTGFVDRCWFDVALAQPQPLPTCDGIGLGVIAVRLDGVTRLLHEGGPAVRDGWLLIAAEVIQSCTGKDDVRARLGDDRFAVLTRRDPAGLVDVASELHARLRTAGISASVGWAMGGQHGGLSAALKSAERRVRASNRSAPATEARASRAVAALRGATAASVLLGEATGILMQWHGCTPDKARRELAHQAHELGLSVTAMARLLVGVASGHLAGSPAARGIELDRTVRLATYTAPKEPTWTVEPPNAASARLALPQPDPSNPAHELRVAGRYQAAAGRSGSGGDWFDGFVLADGAVGLVLGDVAGHDTLAVTIMMQLRSLVRTIAGRSDIAPSEVLRRLDRCLVELGIDRLATVVFGWIHTNAAGQLVLRWCNAGHLAPMLVTSDGEATVLASTNDVLLGLDGPTRRSDLTLALPPGATVLFYSDGLIETRTADIDEGLTRLRAAVRPLATMAVTELRDSLLPAMVAAHTPDDVTLLAIRISGAAGIDTQRGPAIERAISSQCARLAAHPQRLPIRPVSGSWKLEHTDATGDRRDQRTDNSGDEHRRRERGRPRAWQRWRYESNLGPATRWLLMDPLPSPGKP
jgi:GGDEF domain-containing protein